MTMSNNFNLTINTQEYIIENIKKIIKYCLKISNKNKKDSWIHQSYINRFKTLEVMPEVVKFYPSSAYMFDKRDKVSRELEDREKLLQKLERFSLLIQSNWIEEVESILYKISIEEAISYLDKKITFTSKDDLDYTDMLFYKANLLRLNKSFNDALDTYELLLDIEFSYKYVFEYACFLQYSLNNYEKSLVLYKELLNTPLSLEQRAETLYCIASIDYINEKFELAEEEYQTSLSLYKSIDNGGLKYKGKVADIFYKLAILHIQNRNLYSLDIVESELIEALDKYKSLMIRFPKFYLHKIADVLSSLAQLHVSIGKKELAKREYRELIKRYKVLAKKYPDSYYSQEIKKVKQTMSSLV